MVFKKHRFVFCEGLKIYKGLFVLLISIFIMCSFTIFWAIPRLNKIDNQSTKRMDYIKKIEALEGFAKQHSQYDQEIERLKLQHFSIRERLPEKISAKEVISKMQKLASGTGLLLSTTALPRKSSRKQSIEQIRINFKLEGDYFSLLVFLKRLEDKSIGLIEDFCIYSNMDGILKASGIYIQCVYSK